MIQNTNLNINSWLVKCGFMYGHLHDGIIQTTKFDILRWLIIVCISTFTTIKWGILLFYHKESLTSNLLGDWAYFYGPKLFADLIVLLGAVFVLSVLILLYFSSKQPKKMLFWLKHMEFDTDK